MLHWILSKRPRGTKKHRVFCHGPLCTISLKEWSSSACLSRHETIPLYWQLVDHTGRDWEKHFSGGVKPEGGGVRQKGDKDWTILRAALRLTKDQNEEWSIQAAGKHYLAHQSSDFHSIPRKWRHALWRMSHTSGLSSTLGNWKDVLCSQQDWFYLSRITATAAFQ